MGYYSMQYDADVNEKFENFTIKEVLGNDECVEFHSQDGRILYVEVSTECCDDSYFDKDSVEDMKGLVGQTLLSVESVETNAETRGPRPDDSALHDRGRQLVYCLVFKTNSSEISVLWRNDSNGCYYGGVEVKLVDPTSLPN